MYQWMFDVHYWTQIIQKLKCLIMGHTLLNFVLEKERKKTTSMVFFFSTDGAFVVYEIHFQHFILTA